MKIEDKKLKLIQSLIKTDDESVLGQIEFLLRTDEENWNSLSNEERAAIKEGMKQLDEGEGISHESVINELRKQYSP